ncbi:BUD22-domain-containing protein [Syncephalis fuscata]|nr:BUD22-domain-containing protein [Syncephalis fuscata]
MPKRTRQHLSYAIRRIEAKDGQAAVDRVIRMKEEKIRKKLHTIQRELRKDTKKARAFCLQRIIKRIKSEKAEKITKEESIKKRDVRLQQLDQELAALKAIDLDDIAMKALDNAVRQHSQIPSYKVMQRILEDPTALYTQKKKLKNNSSTETVTTSAEQTLNQAKTMQDALQRAVEGILTTVQFLEGERDHTKRESKKTAKARSSSITPTDSNEEKSATVTSSMFMTSLGGHTKEDVASDEDEEKDWDSDISQPSYSDSEDDDDGEHRLKKDDEDPEPIIDYDISQGLKKKNRPGQQARRKMNEERYGRNAHHVRKEMEERRLTQQQQQHSRHAQPHPKKQKPTAFGTNNRRPQQQAATSQVDSSAHPSWEAKRKQKEQEAALLRAKPSGTKIVFDDDD